MTTNEAPTTTRPARTRPKRRPNPELLVTPTMAADRLTVPHATFRTWSTIDGFPEPLLSGGPGRATVYWLPEVEAWRNEHRPAKTGVEA